MTCTFIEDGVETIVRRTASTFHRSSKVGHYCGPMAAGTYKLHSAWVDTDNQVWAEPSHLYTDICRDANL